VVVVTLKDGPPEPIDSEIGPSTPSFVRPSTMRTPLDARETETPRTRHASGVPFFGVPSRTSSGASDFLRRQRSGLHVGGAPRRFPSTRGRSDTLALVARARGRTTQGGSPSPPDTQDELALYQRAQRIEDPERRWEFWQNWFQREGSVLFRWLSLSSMQAAFWGRDPHVIAGYVPRRGRSRKIAKLAIFYLALRNDAGITQRTAYREIKYANDLLDSFGKEWVLALLGTRAANDDHFLRSLIRLRNKEQAKEVADIYIQGAGESQAKKRMEVYLDIQEQAEEEKAKKGKRLPAAPEPLKESLANRLLALGLRLQDVLDVVSAELELAKEEKEIARELAALRAELAGEGKPPRGTKTKATKVGLPPLHPGPDASRKLSQKEIEAIEAHIAQLRARAEPLPKESPMKTRWNREAQRWERRLQGHFMECVEEILPGSDDEA